MQTKLTESTTLNDLNVLQTQFKFHPLLRPPVTNTIANNDNVAEASVFSKEPIKRVRKKEISDKKTSHLQQGI